MNKDDHELLAPTTRGTPMGELLRRFWTPALLSREVEADGAPVRVRLMGEDLIAFRDSKGRVGLLDEHCAHRGASLYFGKNTDCGLRCWYHGWKYDVDGNCLDQPNEPPQTQFKDRVKQTAYPCIERNGAVWAYLGPRETMPPLHDLEWTTLPPSHVHVAKRIQQCHWTQGLEGDIDSSHLGFLHSHATPLAVSPTAGVPTRTGSFDNTPRFELMTSRSGIVQASVRDAGPNEDYWRVGQWFMPGFTTIPPRGGDAPLHGHSWTAMEDGKSVVFTFSWHPARPLRDDEIERMETATNFHVHLIPGTFDPRANRANDYAPDSPPAAQPWMRVKYFQDQDIGATESMGALYDRTQENLGNTDLVIVRVRKRLVDAARDLQRGIEPAGREPQDYRLRPVSMMLPKKINSWSEAVAEPMDARPGTYREGI